MREQRERPANYEEASAEELELHARLGVTDEAAPPAPAAPAATGETESKVDSDLPAPAAEVAAVPEPGKTADDSLPFLPPPDAVPQAETRLSDDIEIDYVGPEGKTLRTTLGKAREAARRLHGLDQLQRSLAPYREMDEGAKAIKDPELRKQMVAELKSVVNRYRTGNPAAAEQAQQSAPSAEALELRERLQRVEQRFAESDQRREERRQDDARVSAAQRRIDRLVSYTDRTFGIKMTEEEIDKTVDRCVQIHKIAMSTKDPAKRAEYEDIAANPVEVWLYDNRERIAKMRVDAAKQAEKGHLDSLRKGAVNPGGSAPVGAKVHMVGARLETMSDEQIDRLSPDQFAAYERDMIARLEGGGQ